MRKHARKRFFLTNQTPYTTLEVNGAFFADEASTLLLLEFKADGIGSGRDRLRRKQINRKKNICLVHEQAAFSDAVRICKLAQPQER